MIDFFESYFFLTLTGIDRLEYKNGKHRKNETKTLSIYQFFFFAIDPDFMSVHRYFQRKL